MARFVIVTLLLVGWTGTAAARRQQEAPPAPPRVVEARRISTPIRVDGVLDEPAWAEAEVADLPYETYPGDSSPARVRTECRIAYDERAMYVAFRAFDPNPAAIRAHLSDRDAAFDDDFVGIVLDTFHDGRRAFEFFVNPYGVQMDLVVSDVGGGEDSSWDAIWDTMGRVTADGYVVEIAIPFSSLRFPRGDGGQTWGLDLIRVYPRDQRYIIKSQERDRDRSCYLCQVSVLEGLQGISPGRNLEIDPTFTAGSSADREEVPDGPLVDSGIQTDVGLTARWGMTPNLTLSATLNPDFSQVEADAAQLSINRRFALFFREKRPFFLEGADFFETPERIVHTRAVADPAWGLKITGKAGPHALGVFVAEDEVTNLIFPGSQGSDATTLEQSNTTGVVRYRHDLGESSTLGFLAAGRRGDGYSNGVAGVDGLIRLGPSDSVEFQLLGSRTEYPAEVAAEFDQRSGRFSGSAVSTRYRHDTKEWSWSLRYEDVREGFRADLGFMPQVDTRFLKASGSRTWWGEEGAFFSRFEVGGDWFQVEDHGGNVLDRAAELWASFGGPWQTHGFVNLSSGDTFFDGKTFDQDSVLIFLNSRPSGSLSLRLFARIGDGVDYANVQTADVVSIEPRVTYRLGRHVSASVDHRRETLRVDGGKLFEANQSELRLAYQINVRTFVRLITQYTDIARNPALYTDEVEPATRDLFNQILFSYKVNPQTVFFLGYSESGFGERGFDITTENRTIFLKIGYAWVL